MKTIKCLAVLLVSLMALLVMMNTPPATAQSYETYPPPGKVMWAEKRSNVRAGPGTNYGKVGVLEVGEKVFVTAKTGSWFKMGPRKRFVFAPLLTLVPPESGTGATKRVAASSGLVTKTITYNNGDRYHGQTRDGKRHGRGVYTWADGERYEGQWRDGDFHGHGIRTWTGGNRYEGDFVDGKRTGRGVYAWPDGERYEGDFVDGKRTGRGVYTWPDGARYDGDFVDGKRHGRGVFTWQGTGEYAGREGRYEGEWRDNQEHGRGVKVWPDGSRWEGKFVDGKRTRGDRIQTEGQAVRQRPATQAGQPAQQIADHNSWGAYTEIGEYWEGHQGYSVVWNAPTADAALDKAVRECWRKYSSEDCAKYMYVFSLSVPVAHDYEEYIDIGGYREVRMFRKRCAAVVTIEFDDGGLDSDIERWFFDSKDEARAYISRQGSWHTFGIYCNGD